MRNVEGLDHFLGSAVGKAGLCERARRKLLGNFEPAKGHFFMQRGELCKNHGLQSAQKPSRGLSS
jgi:hypothetical protein